MPKTKVAFDVQGTLLGYQQEVVLQLYRWFESKGCEMYVWSFGGVSMAMKCVDGLGLKATPMSKDSYLFGELPEGRSHVVDVAVDDDAFSADSLSAETIILVHNIDPKADFDAIYGHLLNKK